MKFLVIRFSSIGDIVLTTPAIRCLKMQLPDAELHFLTKENFKAVTEANPYIDKFFYYKKNLRELIDLLKMEEYDYVIDLHKNFRSYKIRWALNAKVLSYRKLSIEKWLLTKLHINIMPKRHIVDRCLDALKPLGVVNDGQGMDYFIPEKYQHSLINEIPLSHAHGYLAIVIGASYYTKKLPLRKLRELCDNIQYPIVLIGGKEDVQMGDDIAVTDPIRIYNACGKFNLHESARLVQDAKLVISHDTGLLYIACAFNKRVIAIWGGTSPLLDVEPYYGTNNAVQSAGRYTNFVVPHLNCQPCSNYGTKTCPRGHFKCMEQQDMDAIAATSSTYLFTPSV